MSKIREAFQEKFPEINLKIKKPIRLNRQHLKLKPGKDYAEFICFGDMHFGHETCNEEKAEKMLEWCLDTKTQILFMGDLIEASNKYSVGDSVYSQLNPTVQYEYLRSIFAPLSKENLILGAHSGNHEARVYKATGIDMISILCNEFKVPYLGYANWNLFYVGNQSYTVYSLHGSTGSRFIHTKLKSVIDIAHNFDCDLLVQGHVHELASESFIKQIPNRKRKVIEEKKCFVVLTGHYLNYDNSYAQTFGMTIGKTGSPKIKLFSEKRDIHISF